MRRSDAFLRMVRWLVAFGMIATLTATSTLAAAQENGTDTPGTPVTVTFTVQELLEAGQEWADADGNFHLRNEVTLETASGDIEGTATISIDGDFVTTGECTEEFCEGTFNGWVEIDVEGGTGGWSGQAGFIAAETGYETFRGVLIGEGANAGNRIVLDNVVEETEDSISISGRLISRALLASGVNIYYDGCFTGFTETGGGMLAGGFIMSGPVDGSGALDATFNTIGVPMAGVVGDITFSSEHGDLYGTFIASSTVGGGAHNFGSFFLLGGTGSYEGMYGYGKVMETAIFDQPGQCDGVQGYWIGEAFGS